MVANAGFSTTSWPQQWPVEPTPFNTTGVMLVMTSPLGQHGAHTQHNTPVPTQCPQVSSVILGTTYESYWWGPWVGATTLATVSRGASDEVRTRVRILSDGLPLSASSLCWSCGALDGATGQLQLATREFRGYFFSHTQSRACKQICICTKHTCMHTNTHIHTNTHTYTQTHTYRHAPTLCTQAGLIFATPVWCQRLYSSASGLCLSINRVWGTLKSIHVCKHSGIVSGNQPV